MGALTLPLATHGIEVLAVEALPLNVSILLAAVRAGGLKNVRAIHMAVASEPGVAKVSGHSAWGGAVIGDDAGDTPCDTLANILTLFGFSDVDIIKLDVEGAELPALTGSDEFFARRDDTEIMYESNNHTCQNFGYDRQDLTRRFEEMGFRNYMFSDLGLMPFSSTDPQPWPVMDILATRRDEAALRRQGEVIAPMTDDYITRLLLRIADDNSPHTRKHFLTEVNRVSESVKARPDWSRIAAAIAR
jgi:FkbM family methyltransferase